jgi:hypothetical protein
MSLLDDIRARKRLTMPRWVTMPPYEKRAGEKKQKNPMPGPFEED